jgi:hypothetical protein
MYLLFFLCGYLKSTFTLIKMEQISPDINERGVQCQKLAGDNFNICVTFHC